MVAERRKGMRIGGHCVVGKIASHDRSQPASLFGYVLVPAPPEVFGDFKELRHRPITPRMTGQHEAASPRARADVGEPQEVEGLRLSLPARRSRGGGPSAEFNQTGLVPGGR